MHSLLSSRKFLSIALTCMMFSGLSARPVSARVLVTVDANEAADQLEQKTKDIIEAINNSDKDKYQNKSDTFLFFEGNHCEQQVVGSLHKMAHGRETINAKKTSWFENDEARSVLIQGPASAGDFLQICDHPKDCKKDDSATIVLKSDLAEDEMICIGTFESNYDHNPDEGDGYYRIVYNKDNGLDGKVSRVINYDVCARVRDASDIGFMQNVKCPGDLDTPE